MDDKLKRIIENNKHKFSEWINTINKYNHYFRTVEGSKEEGVELTYKVFAVLEGISELYLLFGSFKDEFDTSRMILHIEGIELIIKSTKTGNEFHLGVDDQGIYLETDMRYSENLRHMDDSFYKDIFSLIDLGGFDIQERQIYTRSISKGSKDLYSNNKSKIFRLLRNYIIGVVDEERNIHLGAFHIDWPYEKTFYHVIYNGCLAFKILYGMNYQLWKISDLQSKKKRSE